MYLHTTINLGVRWYWTKRSYVRDLNFIKRYPLAVHRMPPAPSYRKLYGRRSVDEQCQVLLKWNGDKQATAQGFFHHCEEKCVLYKRNRRRWQTGGWRKQHPEHRLVVRGFLATGRCRFIDVIIAQKQRQRTDADGLPWGSEYSGHRRLPRGTI